MSVQPRGRPVPPARNKGSRLSMDSTSLLDQLSGYWSALDQHPILHAGLAFGLLLVGALILGRVARYIVLYLSLIHISSNPASPSPSRCTTRC